MTFGPSSPWRLLDRSTFRVPSCAGSSKMSQFPSINALPPGIHGIEMQSIATDAGPLWFPLADHVMRDHIRSSGTWEPEIGQILCELFPDRGGTFVDVGANVGYFSALIANRFPEATIHAFEPHPLTYQVLQLNVWRFDSRVKTYPWAASEERSTVALVTSQNNLGDTKGLAASNHLISSTVAPSVRLDDVLADTTVDVVKIDVQGAEFAVLGGMSRLIERSRALRIVMEFSPDLMFAEHVDPRSVLEALRERGFTIHQIRPDAFVEASDREILNFCQSAGPMGQANLLLSLRK